MKNSQNRSLQNLFEKVVCKGFKTYEYGNSMGHLIWIYLYKQEEEEGPKVLLHPKVWILFFSGLGCLIFFFCPSSIKFLDQFLTSDVKTDFICWSGATKTSLRRIKMVIFYTSGFKTLPFFRIWLIRSKKNEAPYTGLDTLFYFISKHR